MTGLSCAVRSLDEDRAGRLGREIFVDARPSSLIDLCRDPCCCSWCQVSEALDWSDGRGRGVRQPVDLMMPCFLVSDVGIHLDFRKQGH